MKNILDEIVEGRRAQIAEHGFTLGFEIPERRTRGISPFVARKGAVLEIKRASPSKGDIAPDLDPVQLALTYCNAGACAISVLTETSWFKGGLDDLMKVCAVADEFRKACGKSVAVLRKDFLLEEEEIEVSFRAGADAVLLIARILDEKKIVAMAKKCQSLGITSFIELRKSDDLKKLSLVANEVDSKFIVCGVNARDLKDFSIDLLAPSGILDEIKSMLGSDARVVFESGIRSCESASFAGGLGFKGMLLGEAAARNPDEAKNLVESFVEAQETPHTKKWSEYAKSLHEKKSGAADRPFVKICGITNFDDAKKSAELGADFLGFIFCEKSPRGITAQKFLEIKNQLAQEKFSPRLAAVIIDTESPEAKDAIELARSGEVDFIQLHGFDCASRFAMDKSLSQIPHYAAANISCGADMENFNALRRLGIPRVLIDSKAGEKIGGTGIRVEKSLVAEVRAKTRLWLAGGINAENVADAIKEFSPELLDIASGVEASPGKKDFAKLEKLFAEIDAAK